MKRYPKLIQRAKQIMSGSHPPVAEVTLQLINLEMSKAKGDINYNTVQQIIEAYEHGDDKAFDLDSTDCLIHLFEYPPETHWQCDTLDEVLDIYDKSGYSGLLDYRSPTNLKLSEKIDGEQFPELVFLIEDLYKACKDLGEYLQEYRITKDKHIPNGDETSTDQKVSKGTENHPSLTDNNH